MSRRARVEASAPVSFDVRRAVIAGIIAGLVGAGTLGFFLVVTHLAGRSFGATTAALLAGTAAALLTPAILSNPAAPLIGLVIHVVVSIGWGLGYVFALPKQPFLLTRPWISGAGFGLIVYIMMQIVLLSGGHYQGVGGQAGFVNGIDAYVVFFGLPIGLIVAKLLHTA